MNDIEAFLLSDDGQVPNNPRLPLVLYRQVFERDISAEVAIDCFAQNGWQGAWINGIFDYHHYHARSHEVLANVGPAVTVQFGGKDGPEVVFERGDVVVIPAGCGHCRRSSGAGLTIVGAYPAGQESWDLKRADRPSDYAASHAQIDAAALPVTDPVTGDLEPLLSKFWRGT